MFFCGYRKFRFESHNFNVILSLG